MALTALEKVALWLAVGLPVAVAMEFWARVLHGRIWHRWLWWMHASHHVPRLGRFELNDLLSGTHAPIAIVLIIYGCEATPGVGREVAFGIGCGMTLFGLSYLLVHDGLVHERLPMKFFLRWRFFRRVRGAHLHHHRFHGVPYGLFFGPQELAAAKAAGRDDPGVLRSHGPGDADTQAAVRSAACETADLS